MAGRILTHIAVPVAALAVGFILSGQTTAAEPRMPVMKIISNDANARFVPLGVGKSVVIELPRDIKDVLVADPKIANAVVRTSRRVYIVGQSIGQTNIYFFAADGQQIGGLDIAVTRDLNGIRAALKRDLPGADVHIEGLGTNVVLSGHVESPIEAERAFDIASRLVGGAEGSSDKIVNDITVHGKDQVMLKVTVAEIQRTAIKQLGINLAGSVGLGTSVVNFNTANPFSVNGLPTSSGGGGTMGGTNLNPNPNSFKDGNGLFRNTLQANLQAMERSGVIRTLAEPTLTAISGESATFLAGGKFPFPTPPQTLGGAPGIDFQNFGVSLNFTPVVLSEGRISLKVLTEVSELSPENSVTVSGTTVPGLTVRRADTTLEIPSGGSLTMAGMIEDQTKQDINGVPGLLQLPVIGALFRSRDYLNHQTELVIIVTPYIVRAVAQKYLSRPDDGFVDASDPATILLGSLNRIYGVPGKVIPKDRYNGNIGFILD